MKEQDFIPKGTGVALVTPFRAGKIDFESLGMVIDHVLKGGVEYLVSLGTTGEANMLSEEEQKEVLAFTVSHARGRVPVVAGCFAGNDTADVVRKMERFDLDGCAALLSSSPAYVKPSQEGIYRHFMALEEASPLPIILYNVPGRTASNMSADLCLRLANASQKFIGVKEASGDLVQGSRIAKYAPDHFHLLSGDDPTAPGLIACGAIGVISVIANAFPAIFSSLIRDALSGNREDAIRGHQRLLDLHPLLYVEGNPVGVKAALEILGLARRDVRLPLVPLSQPYFAQLEERIGELLA